MKPGDELWHEVILPSFPKTQTTYCRSQVTTCFLWRHIQEDYKIQMTASNESDGAKVKFTAASQKHAWSQSHTLPHHQRSEAGLDCTWSCASQDSLSGCQVIEQTCACLQHKCWCMCVLMRNFFFLGGGGLQACRETWLHQTWALAVFAWLETHTDRRRRTRAHTHTHSQTQ